MGSVTLVVVVVLLAVVLVGYFLGRRSGEPAAAEPGWPREAGGGAENTEPADDAGHRGSFTLPQDVLPRDET